MTKNEDNSGKKSSNNEKDLSNNDLSNNDLSNNDISNNELMFNEIKKINDKLLNINNENSSDESDNETEDKLNDDIYNKYLYEDSKDDEEQNNNPIENNPVSILNKNTENTDVDVDDDEYYDVDDDDDDDDNCEEKSPEDTYLNNLSKIDNLLKIIDEMYILDKNINYLNGYIDNNNDANNDANNNANNDDKKTNNQDKNVKLTIKDNNKNNNMNTNKFNNLLKDMDNGYNNNNNNMYYNVNDLLLLNDNNIYKDKTTINNTSLVTNNKNIYGNENYCKSEPNPEPESEPEIIKEKVNVEASIDNIEDLIKMIDKYPLEKHIEYNINMKAMHDIKPDLIELNKMIGMHNLKMNIVDQILYFIQDLHINEKKKNELKNKQEKKEKKETPKKPTINIKGGGLFAGLDLSSAFGGGAAPKEPVCTDNDNNDYLHTVIYGPPGTGKTEVAKIMGKIYSKLGILKKGLFRKATRSDFVAGYLGQTAMKTKDLIDECLGGVLFIDEAYALGNNEGRDSFAKEAIDTLCEALSNHKNDIMVIIAGYEKELKQCFFSFNQGLESRFPWRFKTEDYKPEELKLIFKKQIIDNQWKINDEDLKDEWFNSKMTYFKHYGRDMETLFSKVKIAHGRRIFCNLDCEKKLLTIQDLDKGFESYLDNENKQNIEQERVMKQIRDTIYV